jgi:hypothetical protein
MAGRKPRKRNGPRPFGRGPRRSFAAEVGYVFFFL